MPSINSFTLTFDALNEWATFSEGDTIRGNVTLHLLKETPVQSLFVKAKGDAEVRWTTRTNDRTHTHTAHRRYFKEKQFLIPEDSKDTVLLQGIHVYTFSLAIPQGSMPSSFRGPHGKIVYRLEAKLSRSWRLDSTIEKEINFVSKSIPKLHSLMLQQVGSTAKELGLFSKGRVNMDVTVDKRAYAPGETMLIVAKVNNSSSSEMTPKFSFVRNVLYRATSSKKHECTVCLKVVDNNIKPKTEKEIRCAMKIPNDQMQTIQNCDIISVEYHLKAYLDISFAFDPEILFPVVILPRGFAPGSQSGGAVSPYAAGAAGGPSNSDFPPPAAPVGPYPVSPHSGSYAGTPNYSAAPPAYPDNPQFYGGPPLAYRSQPTHMHGGYNNPVPHQPSLYGSPFSSSSSASVLHPPPPSQEFHISPSAPVIQPPTTSQTPTAPTYNLLPSASMMDANFLSQSDEDPPAYSLLFPSSSTETSGPK
ncbi:arrestin domain-containing protein 3-like [Pholidichthys leucotaenia]